MSALSTAVCSLVASGPSPRLQATKQADGVRSPRVRIGKQDTERKPAPTAASLVASGRPSSSVYELSESNPIA